MAKKIDDEILLKLVAEGKPQKEIALMMNVSEPAISKRLKRLTPPPDLSHLTEKQKLFSLEIARGEHPTDAALTAYDCKDRDSAKVVGFNLLKDEDINKSIKELLDYSGMTRSYRLKRLKHWVDHPDGNLSLRGLDQAWKLDGYIERVFTVTTDYQTICADIADLNRQLAELQNDSQD